MNDWRTAHYPFLGSSAASFSATLAHQAQSATSRENPLIARCGQRVVQTIPDKAGANTSSLVAALDISALEVPLDLRSPYKVDNIDPAGVRRSTPLCFQKRSLWRGN